MSGDERVRMEFEAHELQHGQLTRWETWQAAYLAGDRKRATEVIKRIEGVADSLESKGEDLMANALRNLARVILEDAGIGEIEK
jgi:hypothetical protein